MNIISYINEGKPVYSIYEGDTSVIIALLYDKYIGKEIVANDFSNKKITVTEKGLAFEPYGVKEVIIDNDPIESFEATVKGCDNALFFDTFSCYIYDGSYTETNREDYKIYTCEECGRIVGFDKYIEGYCLECFVDSGIQKMFKEIESKSSEQYTEYEKISELYDTVDAFKSKISRLLASADVAKKAQEIVADYISVVPEKYSEKILGGFAA